MAKLVAGIDIGNTTTGVALVETGDVGGQADFLSSTIIPTTDIKGTSANIRSPFCPPIETLDEAGRRIEDLDSIRINETVPAIDDVAMETITETIITESTMIGHNPSTPGGLGIGVGTTIALDGLPDTSAGQPYIAVASRTTPYDQAAIRPNAVAERLEVTGAILQAGDDVLVHNRLAYRIPIIDEMCLIERVPLGMLATIEVADVGCIVETLSSPFGIVTLFGPEANATRSMMPLARSLMDSRSVVVIKAPEGDVQERRIPVGRPTFRGINAPDVDVDLGTAETMDAASRIRNLSNTMGEAGTDVGGMMEEVRVTMAQLINQHTRDVCITDLFAVDTRVSQQVAGGIANELSMEAAIGIAVMVRADRLQTRWIASELAAKVGVSAEIDGVETDMAIRDAFTVPGTAIPIAILDMGTDSTDTSVMRSDGAGTSIHLTGTGNTVTLIIQSELDLDSFDLTEDIKHHPLTKVESVFNIRHEGGTVRFFEDPLPGHVYTRTVVLRPDDMVPPDVDLPIKTIRQARIRAKEQVFVTNVTRILQRVSPALEVRGTDLVVLVGNSALDFEIPQLVTQALVDHRVVAGCINIHGVEGSHSTVAAGLVLGGVS